MSEANDRTVATNRRARHAFDLLDTWEAGLVLRGSEVKSLRDAKVQITESFGRPENGEIWLLGLHISPYSMSGGEGMGHDPDRPRKLLLHRDEINTLARHVEGRGLTAIPLQLLLVRGWAKAEIGLVRGRRQYDKRDKIRAQDDAREIARHLG